MSIGDTRIVDHENWVDEDVDFKLKQTVNEFEVNHSVKLRIFCGRCFEERARDVELFTILRIKPKTITIS